MNQPRKGVVGIILAAIFLLAALVCGLHWINAVSLRGTIAINEYEIMNLTDLNKNKLIVSEPWTDGSVLHIEGALLRFDQSVGKVNLRVGLIEKKQDGESNVDQRVILLNTQMVRRRDLATEYGCDDHCGFHAAVATAYLDKDGDGVWSVVLTDKTGDKKQMILTGIEIGLNGNEVSVNQMPFVDEVTYHAE